MRDRLVVVLMLVVFVAAPSPRTQVRPEAVLTEYQTVQLAAGIYAFIAPESKTPFVSGNSLVVIGDDGVLVVDSGNVPSLTRRMIGEIKRWTDRPVRYLVNTHWHPDHLMGNEAYKAAFPNLAVVTTTAMRETAASQVPAYFAQLEQNGPGMLDTLRQILKSGKRPNGAELSPSDREFFELQLADFEAWSVEAKRTTYVPATVTFDKEMVVHLGGREVRLLFPGRGNTSGDAVVYVPDARVVATGDLLVGPTPYATASFLREWIGVMHSLMAMDATTIVPGHGPVEHDWAHAKQVTALLEAVTRQVDAAVAKGLSLDDTRTQVDVASYRASMTGGDPFRARAFDQFFLATAVDRAWREAMYRAEK